MIFFCFIPRLYIVPAYPPRSHEFTPVLVLVVVRVTHNFSFCVVLLCVLTFRVPRSDVRYDFHIKPMFSSSLPPVICRTSHVMVGV